jgi:hypothetical protein
MKTLLSILTLFVMQAAASPQTQMTRTIVSGTVTRVGSNDPIPDAEVTLTVGFPSEGVSAVARGVSALGIQAAGFQSAAAQLMTMSPQEIQVQINQFKAQGLPQGLITAVEAMQSAMKANPNLPLKAVTDGSGHFTMRDVPPGRYALIVQREGYFGPSPNGSPQLPQSSISPVVVPEQAVPQTANVSLVPGGVLSGRVRDANGRFANNAAVQAFTVEYQNGLPTLAQVATKQTDDRGEFRMAYVQPGSYIVAATPRTPAVSATAVNAAPKEIAVRTFYPDSLDATKAMRVSVSAGDDIGGIDVSLRAVLPAKVSGQVISSLGVGDASTAPPSVLLMLSNRDITVPENARNAGTIGLNPTTGSFELRDILPGSYELFARIQDPRGTPGANGLTPMAWGRASFDVRDRNVEGVSITVHPSIDVRGKVTLDGKAPASANALRVGLQADGPSLRIANYTAVAGRQQTPAADGAFTVPAVAEGAYRFLWSGLPADSYVSDVRQGGTSIYDAGLYVTDKSPEPIEIVMRSDGGTFEGLLTRANSQPMGRTLVVLVPQPGYRSNPSRYKTTLSDLQGHFTVHGIQPGTYKAFAWENLPDGAYFNADFLKMHENEGIPVEVLPRQTTTAAVRLIENGRDRP